MGSSRLAVSRAGPAKNHLKHTAMKLRRKKVSAFISRKISFPSEF
jgi:hypothetical protein